MRRRDELGGSGIKVLLSILFLALIVHVGWVFIPRYIAVYDFNSKLESVAQYGAARTNDAITKELLAYAAERHLDVKKENLRVERTQSRLTIYASYVVSIKTVLYTYDWQVSTEKSAVLF